MLALDGEVYAGSTTGLALSRELRDLPPRARLLLRELALERHAPAALVRELRPWQGWLRFAKNFAAFCKIRQH